MYIHQEYIDKNKQNRSDWRLPRISELMLMFDYEEGKPIIEGFTSSFYWSSTTSAYNANYAWYVNFYTGNTDYGNKTDGSYVRCMRETPDGIVWSKSTKEGMTWYDAVKYAESLNEQ